MMWTKPLPLVSVASGDYIIMCTATNLHSSKHHLGVLTEESSQVISLLVIPVVLDTVESIAP